MLPLLFYYLILPFLVFAVLLKLLRRYAPGTVPPEVQAYCAARPVPKGGFRAMRVESAGPDGSASCVSLGDFEKQDDALDAAFAAKHKDPSDTPYLVLNDQGEILRQL